MSSDFAILVYNTRKGLYRPNCGVLGVNNAFAENSTCAMLYSQAFDAYQRLCDRLGVIDEDKDVQIIFDAFSDICKIMALEMYHYGEIFSQLTSEQMDIAAKSITTLYKKRQASFEACR